MIDRPTIHIPAGAVRPSGLWLPSGAVDRDGPRPSALRIQGTGRAGLTLVARSQPDLSDALFRAVPTEEELDFEPTSLDVLRAWVAMLPFDSAVLLYARLAAEAWHAGADEHRQLALARDLLPTGARVLEQIEKFFRAGEGSAVFIEQQLFALIRLAIEESAAGRADEDSPASEQTFMLPALRTLFAALTVVTNSIDELPGSDSDVKRWIAVLVQNGGYNAKTPPLSAFTRALRLLELAAGGDVGEPQDRCDINAWLEDDLHLSPAEQFAIGFSLGAAVGAFNEDHPVDERSLLGRQRVDDILDQLGLRDRKQQALEAISAPREWYVEQFARGENTAMDVSWRRIPFEQRPFLRWGDGHLLLLSPRGVLSWLGEGFHHRVFACAERRGEAMKRRYSRYQGQLVEAYSLELAESVYPTLKSMRRVHGEQRYGKGGGRKTSDIAVDCAPDLVLFEVAGQRLKEHSRVLADWDSVASDLKRMLLTRIKKLDGCVDALLADDADKNKARIPGVSTEGLRHIWPVIVTAGEVFQSELLWDYIEENAAACLKQPKVQQLTLLDLDDFELLMGLVEGGSSLVDLLRRKAASQARRMSLNQWRHHDPTAPPERRPDLLADRMGAAGTAVMERLGLDASQIQTLRTDSL